MKTRSQLQTKHTPKPSFTPVQTGLLQRKCACGNSASLTRKCTECENKRLTLQRRSQERDGVSEVPPIVHEVLGDTGQPLDTDALTFMESRFAHDFSKVRVHTDAKAAESVQAVQALAYTVGRHIVFGAGQYAPQTREGQRLLAHELTHVIQQGSSQKYPVEPKTEITPLGNGGYRLESDRNPNIDGKSESLEKQADEVAESVFHPTVHQIEKNPIQQKLTLGVPNDGYEQEADQIADRIVQISKSEAKSSVHTLVQPVSKQSSVIQRYGHTNSCKDDVHLKPFIWPGHDHAKKVTTRAIEELNKVPLHPTATNYLKRLFGKDSTTGANLATIRQNFGLIQNALNQQYLYHCANPCEKPHKGARAWTDDSGNKDITICFDQVTGYTAPAAGWLIVHENVHRGLNVWPKNHPWQPKNFDGCFEGEALSAASMVLDNPDSYACFASRMWFPL
jgi:Domain of unknown function (DUF4157)